MKISHVELQSEVLRQTSKQAWDLAQERDRCLYASVSVFACMHACMYVSTPDLNETLMPPPTAPSPPRPSPLCIFLTSCLSRSLSRVRALRALQSTSVRLLALKAQGTSVSQAVPRVGVLHGVPIKDTGASSRDTGVPSRESPTTTVTTGQDEVWYEGDVEPGRGDGDEPGLVGSGGDDNGWGGAGEHDSETVLLRTATRSSSIGFAESSSSALSESEMGDWVAEGWEGGGMSEVRGGKGQRRGGDAGRSGRSGGEESGVDGGAAEREGGRQRMKEREKERERQRILSQELRVRPSSALTTTVGGGGGKVPSELRRGSSSSVRVVRPESLALDKLGVKPQVMRPLHVRLHIFAYQRVCVRLYVVRIHQRCTVREREREERGERERQRDRQTGSETGRQT